MRGQMYPDGTWDDETDSTPKYGVVETVATNLVSQTIAGLSIANRLLWRGHSVASGFPRNTDGVSIFYSFVDDKNTNGIVDAGDDFVTTEYLVVGNAYTTNTLARLPVQGPQSAQSYGLTCANILGSSNDVFFTAEPDGVVYSWVAPVTTNQAPLARAVFDGHYAGKAWHQLGKHRGLEPGESLVGLLVDPTTPNRCSLIYWSPRAALPPQPDVRQTAPQTLILPTPNSGGPLSTVSIRLWDAEGNASTPTLQYATTSASNWANATITAIDGSAPNIAVAAMPTGTTHSLTWNAAADLPPGFNTNVLLRARARDITLTGEWSPVVTYRIELCADCDGDEMPDWWEIQHFASTNTPNGCASCDYDGDGQPNLHEYLAGTIPTDATDVLRIISYVGSTITWRSVPGKTYKVLYADTPGGPWRDDLPDSIRIAGPGETTKSYTDPTVGSAAKRYYKVRLIP